MKRFPQWILAVLIALVLTGSTGCRTAPSNETGTVTGMMSDPQFKHGSTQTGLVSDPQFSGAQSSLRTRTGIMKDPQFQPDQKSVSTITGIMSDTQFRGLPSQWRANRDLEASGE